MHYIPEQFQGDLFVPNLSSELPGRLAFRPLHIGCEMGTANTKTCILLNGNTMFTM